MTSYTGVCVFRLANGQVYDVQVKDAAGILLTLNPDDYKNLNCKPPMDQLPTCSGSNSNKTKEG